MSDTGDVKLLKEILPKCSFIWNQGIINQAEKIIAKCETDEKIDNFFDDCEEKIKQLDNCVIKWNLEINKFGGDEYSYSVIFFSDLIDSTLKIAVCVDLLEQVISVGRMDIATHKEQKKLQKTLKSS